MRPTCRNAHSRSKRSFAAPVLTKGFFKHCLSKRTKSRNLIVDPRVKAVTLTGSERAGSAVAKRGRARNQKSCARTRRKRRVHRHAKRGFQSRAHDCNQGAHNQQRTILHRSKKNFSWRTKFTTSSFGNWSRECARLKLANRWMKQPRSAHSRRSKFLTASMTRFKNRLRQARNY